MELNILLRRKFIGLMLQREKVSINSYDYTLKSFRKQTKRTRSRERMEGGGERLEVVKGGIWKRREGEEGHKDPN